MALWLLSVLLPHLYVLVGVRAQLANVILQPDCGPGVTIPCTIVPAVDAHGRYIYDYQLQTCTDLDCKVTAVTTDPTWFCYDVVSGMGGAYQARVEVGIGIGALAFGKKEDNYARCQVSRLKDLLSLGDCRTPNLWTCNDCVTAYKRWICAIQFPKCIPYPFHLGIPMANNTVTGFPKSGTRIKATTTWGYGGDDPNFVVNPCMDICYDVVRKCPPALNFGCPTDTRDYGYPPHCNNFNLQPIPL